MRVLIATGLFPPDIGGPATYSKLLFDELKKRGIGVSVASFGEVRRLPKLIRHTAYFLKICFRGRRADVIFAQDPVSTGLPALCAARLLRKKFVIRVAGDYAWEQGVQRFGVTDSIDAFQRKRYGLRVGLLRGIQRMVVRSARAVVTPSEYFRNLVSGWVGKRGMVVTIYNGIAFATQKISKEQARKELGLPAHAKILLSAGRLVPWKGFMKLIEIMEELSKQFPLWRLIIAGDGPEKNNLERAIRERKLEDSVVLAGSQPREKLSAYLSAADIFVLNTAFESFSYVLVEAMAAGVPVVATNIGNLAEIVTDGKEGLLVRPNNGKQLLEAINAISGNQGLREKLAANAKKKAQEFSIERTTDQLLKVLSSK